MNEGGGQDSMICGFQPPYSEGDCHYGSRLLNASAASLRTSE